MTASQRPPTTGSTGVAPSTFVERVRSRMGTPYRAAGEWVLANPAPPALRPAELIAWSVARARGPVPLAVDVVDLYWQCVDAGTVIERSAAEKIEGALLFRFATTTRSSSPSRERWARRSVVTAEVTVTTGDGDAVTVDLASGVVRIPIAHVPATHAALVPGLEYPAEASSLMGRVDAIGRDTAGFVLRGDLPWLREGVRGALVAQAQALLITAGSSEQSRIGPTGTFDRGTAQAVNAFQHRVRSERGASVAADGSIGPATWGWLFVYAGNNPSNDRSDDRSTEQSPAATDGTEPAPPPLPPPQIPHS